MAKSPTAYLALQLPVPGSKEPFRVADVVEWFTQLDTKHQTTDGAISGLDTRLDKVDASGGAGGIVGPAVVPAGTAAQRDAYYGTAGTAAERVALANKYPRWLNTDKGWEEQYYAKFDDAGVVASTPVKDNFGWAPAAHVGRVLLTRYTAAINGTGTVTKKGGKVEFATAQGLLLDNVFSADFARYELELSSSVVSSSTALEMRFRSGGATNSTSNYAWNFREIVPGAAEANAGPVSEMIVSRAFSGGFALRSVIDNPFDAARKTFVMNHMMDADTKTRIGGSQYSANASFDGIWLDLSGTGTFTGELRIYGVTS